MDQNGNAPTEQAEMPPQKQPSNGVRVRDMIKRYDTAVRSDSAKTSFSSIPSAKSSYFGVDVNNANTNSNSNGNINSNGNNFPANDNSSYLLFSNAAKRIRDSSGSPSRSSSSSRQTVRSARSPRVEMPNEVQVSTLETQKSFVNLSRSREPPRAAPREKKPRHSTPPLLPLPPAPPALNLQQSQMQQEEHANVTDSSYQSKTTILKTPNGVRIVIDIFFDQNKGLTIEDVVGSLVETDIPPSKILAEFQKRVAESARN